jgi:hypothetical protein
MGPLGICWAILAKMKTANGDSSAFEYTTIYAQWGNAPKALEWLDTAMRLRDPGLESLKTEPLMDPLRKEPRFQAVSGAGPPIFRASCR